MIPGSWNDEDDGLPPIRPFAAGATNGEFGERITCPTGLSFVEICS